MRNKKQITQIMALALSMTGCEFISPRINERLPLQPANKIEGEEGTQIPQLANPITRDTSNKTKVELFPDEDSSVKSVTSTNQMSHARGKGEYSLNFDDADLGEVTKVILGDILGRNYTISPQGAGKVTLQTSTPLTKEELIPTLEMLLGLNNAALTQVAGAYLIKPASEALYSSAISSLSSAKMPIGYQVRVIPVKNVSATDLSEILKPLMPEKSILHVDTARNIILAAGTGVELTRLMDVVNTFDGDILKGRSFGLFTPANVSAGKIINELNQIFNNKKESEFFRFIEIERLNAILAITHQSSYLKNIESWVTRLDKINTDAVGGVNVYRAQHVSAVELAETLSHIYGSGGGMSGSRASIASGRRSTSASNRNSGFGGSSNSMSGGQGGFGNSASGTGGIAGNNTGGGTGFGDSSQSGGSFGSSGSGFGGGSNSGFGSSSGTGSSQSAFSGSSNNGSGNNDLPNVKIIPDIGNNSLVIVASAQEYQVIKNVLKQIDVLPLQVMIDATILEVTLKDELQYGINWYLTHQNGGTNVINGGAGQGFSFKEIATGVATGGFSYAFSSGSQDINAVLKANATNNNMNIISSPSLMVLNNQEASIKVGDSVPIRASVSTNLNNTAGIQTSSIQMVDTGVQLSVRPRVNAGGLVLMEILQSVSEATKTNTSDTIDSPTIIKREIDTRVAIQSGETIVLGGLIKDKNVNNKDGVPVLHTIPLIGPLFGGTARNNNKTELVVLLTPRVMKSRQDAQDITEEFRRKLTGIYIEPAIDETTQIQ